MARRCPDVQEDVKQFNKVSDVIGLLEERLPAKVWDGIKETSAFQRLSEIGSLLGQYSSYVLKEFLKKEVLGAVICYRGPHNVETGSMLRLVESLIASLAYGRTFSLDVDAAMGVDEDYLGDELEDEGNVVYPSLEAVVGRVIDGGSDSDN